MARIEEETWWKGILDRMQEVAKGEKPSTIEVIGRSRSIRFGCTCAIHDLCAKMNIKNRMTAIWQLVSTVDPYHQRQFNK